MLGLVLLVSLLLILMNGVYVAAEFALIGSPKASLEGRASRGDRFAARILRTLISPRRQDEYIATSQLGITLASLGLGMYGEHRLAEIFEHAIVAIGPMARANLMTSLHAQVEKTVAAGATLMTGGKPLEGDGFYYPPTVLDHVSPEMTAFREETFGPVAAIIRVKDAEEAIRLANQTEFGLGSAIWSKDVRRARDLARDLDAGAVFINGMVASDPRLPFGGVKRSGYGRELAAFRIREFVNIQTIVLNDASGTSVQLAAVPTAGQISLIWDANTEKDLAGYLVLRGEGGPDAPLAAITPAPIRETSYRDTTVKPGVTYVYVVVAVDNATPPNTSPQSARVQETAR